MIHAVDFFCGSGGLTRGLLNSGVNVLLGIDVDESCKKTYEHNNRPAIFLTKDIQQLEPNEIEEYLFNIPNNELAFVACAPCQPFSQQRTRRSNNSLRTMLGEILRFIEYYEPAYVFAENVPGIAKVKGYSTYKRFCSSLKELGYNFVAGDVDAKNYGVPQSRIRHILVATKTPNASLPVNTHGDSLLPYKTVRDAIAHYPKIRAGQENKIVPNHVASPLSRTNYQRIRHTPADGGSRTDWPKELWLKCHKNGYTGHKDVYGRMRWDGPAPTLTCKCNSISNGRYGHPEQNRAISLREAASLQSFSDDYVFFGNKLSISRQIGNAVPVKLGEAVGNLIISLSNRNGILAIG